MKSLLSYKFLSIAGFSFISLLLATIYIFPDSSDIQSKRAECGENASAVIDFGPNKEMVTASIADDPDERRIGLMYRESLDENEGMLFVFPQAVNNGFWMKNTRIPLDMIFLNHNYVIVSINQNAQPCVEGEDCPTYLSNTSFRYVLEVNEGFTEENNIREGDLVEIEFADIECDLT